LPEYFGSQCYAPATTALSLVLFHLSWPHRYKDYIEIFGHEWSWLSWVFNGTCQHIDCQWHKMLQWNHALLAPA
ncbi:hypothetical protein L873DRAFT_1918874, partial [Choiromyces venosus 120613-1]